MYASCRCGVLCFTFFADFRLINTKSEKMEDLSRAELIQQCEKLQKKLNKYESRLSGKLLVSFAIAPM